MYILIVIFCRGTGFAAFIIHIMCNTNELKGRLKNALKVDFFMGKMI